MNDQPIRTPQTHPNDPVVGKHFGGYSSEQCKTAIFLCDSYDPRIGYWMTNVNNPKERHNVSERAIGRTFHEAEDQGDHWHIRQWNCNVPKQAP